MNLAALLKPQVGNCWRVVETQEVAATREITRSAQEQRRLEELLDDSKPAVPADCRELSYLLMTPFRYPPLKYGSRFGSIWERGIFYGSVELSTAFAETAVYFWLFQSGPLTLGPLEYIRDQRTALSVKLASQKALDLRSGHFAGFAGKITDPGSWDYTQKLGGQLREAGAEFIWYPSARAEKGTNIAVFSPSAFGAREPDQQQHWHVRLNSLSCWFGRPDNESIEFLKSDFVRDDKIPHPEL